MRASPRRREIGLMPTVATVTANPSPASASARKWKPAFRREA
jgi:hypothetical protein